MIWLSKVLSQGGDYTFNASTFDAVLVFCLTAGAAVVGWSLRELFRLSNVVSRLVQRLDDHDRRLQELEDEAEKPIRIQRRKRPPV